MSKKLVSIISENPWVDDGTRELEETVVVGLIEVEEEIEVEVEEGGGCLSPIVVELEVVFVVIKLEDTGPILESVTESKLFRLLLKLSRACNSNLS